MFENPERNINNQLWNQKGKNEITSALADKRLYRSHPVLCQRCVSQLTPFPVALLNETRKAQVRMKPIKLPLASLGRILFSLNVSLDTNDASESY